MTVDIDALERLLAAAKTEAWVFTSYEGPAPNQRHQASVCNEPGPGENPDGHECLVTTFADTEELAVARGLCVAACCESMPDLIRELRAARETIARLKRGISEELDAICGGTEGE